MGRNKLIDMVRFFAIFLVVLGHAIQFNSPNPFDNIFFRMIYSFHMPLFFFISGYVSYNSILNNKFNISSKFLTLLYPFFLWSVFYSAVKNNTFDFLNTFKLLIYQPDSGYWFLWALFWIYVVVLIIRKINNNYLIAILIVLFFMIPTKDYGVSLVKYHMIYFLFGLAVFKYKYLLSRFSITNNQKILIVLFSFIMSTLYTTNNIEYYELIGYGLGSKFLVYGLKIFIASCMILATFLIANFILMRKYIFEKYILKIGALYTLNIYLMHFFFINQFEFTSVIISTIVNFIFAFLATLLVTYILEKIAIKKLSYILFGRL
jgi:fucose 4-O-acetylase-like acetyltransferase